LWAERWNEEVENNPIARQCRKLGNILMSDPNKLTAYLHGLSNDSKKIKNKIKINRSKSKKRTGCL
jgi:hypothetical protein